MSYPQPPHDPHVPGSGAGPGAGGGFGPPQGFGPPDPAGPPAGGYGYPGPPGPPQGYGPGGPGPGGPGMPGGPGPYPPPPSGSGGNGPKVAAIVIAAVLAAALVVGGVLLLGGGDKDGKDDATPSDTATATQTPDDSAAGPPDEPTGIPSFDLPTDAPAQSGDPTQSPGPGELVPFVVLDPGTCFDHPALSSAVSEVEKRPCSSPHNGEVITNRKLPGGYSTEKEIRDEVLRLCKKDAEARLQKMPQDGTLYYFYAIYPSLPTYQVQGEDTISCSLTLSNARDGKKLTEPLPGS